MASDEHPWAISHSVVDMSVTDFVISITVMCNYIQFVIETDARDLKGHSSENESPLYRSFLHFKDNFDEEMEEYQEWAIDPCFSYIHKHAKQRESNRIPTLEDYFDPPTHYLQLKNFNECLKAVEFQLEVPYRLCPKTSLHIDMPELSGMPLVSASELAIKPDPGTDGYDYCGVPRLVRKGQNGPYLAFKPGFEEGSLSRELVNYSVLRKAPPEDLNSFPKFVSLVTMEDGSLLGFLMERIDCKGILYECVNEASLQERKRWFQQINQAVKTLHRLNIIWGDVQPQNVLIDADGNARVIDFGGGFNPEWVDQELADSKEGDLQGVQRLEEYLNNPPVIFIDTMEEDKG